jgi:hypothetical protein
MVILKKAVVDFTNACSSIETAFSKMFGMEFVFEVFFF